MKLNKKIMIFDLVMIAVILVGTAVGIKIWIIENPNMNNTPFLELDIRYYENLSNYPNNSKIIKSVDLNRNILTIKVQYGGGCKEHIFSLFGSPVFMKSNPVQTDVMLSHNANNDMCKALITEELSFDLAPLKELWQENYGESGTININLDGFDEVISYEF